MAVLPSLAGAERLHALEHELVRHAHDLALFLVYDRPEREHERPGLSRTYFAERCVSDEYLDVKIDAFQSIGAYVEFFAGERAWMSALSTGRLQQLPQRTMTAFNGIGWGIGVEGFMPGRKALVPLLADAYGITCINSDAHACAVTVHKFHSSLVLEGLSISTPRTWHYRPPHGWIGYAPPPGARVIVKSTYEAWSVGVTSDSIFIVDDRLDARVAAIAERIGQAVTVQEFVSGREVRVPVWSCPERILTPPMEAIMTPGDPDSVTTIDDSIRGSVSYQRFDGPKGLIERLCAAAVSVTDAFDLYGLARIDFRIDDEDRPWVIDIAIDPGLSAQNSTFQSLAEFDFDHQSFLRTVVAATLAAKRMLYV